jgi:hypothetical protein
VLACAALLSIHSCSLGAPILLEEAKAAGVAPAEKSAASTPACDAMRAVGQWNTAWNPFVELDPLWTDEFFAAAIPLYRSGVLPAKELGLFSIACDASFTHMLPGRTRMVDQPGTGPRSNRNPLDLIKRNLIAGPIIELRCARAFMRRHGLRVFQRAAGFEIGRDPRGAKGMAADPYARRWTMRQASTRCIGVSVSTPVRPTAERNRVALSLVAEKGQGSFRPSVALLPRHIVFDR